MGSPLKGMRRTPPARVEEEDDCVGLPQKSLYGTRDAAASFQAEVRSFMLSVGFQQAPYSPCIFWHQGWDLKALVHGDDFMTTGNRSSARWFHSVLQSRFEIKTVVVGAGDGETGEGRILGRIVRATSEGWEYEADSRHG